MGVNNKGLQKDTSHLNQPENSTTFALNAVLESLDGDSSALSNENSNAKYAPIKSGYSVLSSLYIGDGETLLFLLNKENNISEIGVLKDTTSFVNQYSDSNYKTWCNDEESSNRDKLNFRSDKPISSVYRVRRGCEKVVYFTDDFSEPRFINLQKPENFLVEDESGNKTLSSKKFKLLNTYDLMPEISSAEVIEGAGNLKSGSYSVMLQYLDEDFNPSPTVLEVNDIHIYRDSIKQKYHKVQGSTSLETESNMFDPAPTNKAIKITFGNFDKKYPFYRVIVCNYTSGTGGFVDAYASIPISTENTSYIHSNNSVDGLVKLTEEELVFSDNETVFERAKHVEQIDNTLVFSNTKGMQADLCSLQKYASKIAVDCYVKEYSVNNTMDRRNSKNPMSSFEGLSFMPGEIYSLGIMYLFEDLSTSPTYHIPGKGFNYAGDGGIVDISDKIYSFEEGKTYPMMNEKDKDSFGVNSNENITYTDRSFCNSGEETLWGRDAEGHILDKTVPVRHHRFPTRNKIVKPLITKSESTAVDSDGSESNIFYVQNDFSDFYKEEDSSFDSGLYLMLDVETSDGDIMKMEFDLDSSFQEEIFNKLDATASVVKITLNEVSAEGKTELKVIYSSQDSATINSKHSENPSGLSEEKMEDSFLYTVSRYRLEGSDVDQMVYEGDSFPDTGKVMYQSNKIRLLLSKSALNYDVDNIYKANSFGVKLSNIEIPSEEIIGKKVIGYYVMKHHRGEEDKTILTSGIITPTVPHKRYRNLDWFAPYFTGEVLSHEDTESHENTEWKVSRDCFGLVTLDHIFGDRVYDNFSEIEEQGVYKIVEDRWSGYAVVDALGEKFAGETSSSTEDPDRMSLRHLTQYSIAEYANSNKKDKFVLKNEGVTAYNLQPCTYGEHSAENDLIYNLSFSNKRVALAVDKKGEELDRGTEEGNWDFYRPGKKELPYVYLKKDKTDFYVNFRQAPYYKINEEFIPISREETVVFGGDIHIVPFRPTSHSYQGTVSGFRQAKKSFVKMFIGFILTIVAALVTVLTVGIGTGAGVWIAAVGVGLMVGGSIMLGVAEQVRAENVDKMLKEHWEEKLDKTVFDTAHWMYFLNPLFAAKGGVKDSGWVKWNTADRFSELSGDSDYSLSAKSPCLYEDDTVFTRGKVLADIWFETTINASLYSDTVESSLSPLPPLAPHLEPNPSFWSTWTKGRVSDYNRWNYNEDNVKIQDQEIKYGNSIDNHFFYKTFGLNSENKFEMQNISLPTVYYLNGDFNIPHKIKTYYHLPIEYDCCSDCRESFNHRMFWSNQSFSEELTDNYRVFKPNNYKDIHGETGEVTNIFVLNNSLYLQTEEAMWLQPKNTQERITDQIVSFIGTGESYSLPPQKIIDSKTGYSGGTSHKQGFLQTPYGVFYPSEIDRKFYMFNGKLESISDRGMQKYFNKNLPIRLDSEYKALTDNDFEFRDNVTNTMGTGYISVYDKQNERIILTKKDFLFSAGTLPGEDYKLCGDSGDIIIHRDMSNTIKTMSEDVDEGGEPWGWDFLGIEDCRMKFVRRRIKTKKTISTRYEQIFKDADYLVFYYDYETYTDLDTVTQLLEPTKSGRMGWNLGQSDMTDYIEWSGDNTGSGLESIKINVKRFNADFPGENIVFQTGAYWHTNSNIGNGQGNVRIKAVAYKGGTMSLSDFEFINSGGIVQGEFTFSDVEIVTPKVDNADSPQPTGKFTFDPNTGTLDSDTEESSTELVTVKAVEYETEVQYEEEQVEYIKGEGLDTNSFYDNSITVSYSLKHSVWTSFHSYFPECYIDMEKEFYSWSNKSNFIYKHNIPNSHQNFYGKRHPFIIEFVNNENPLQTKIFEYLTFMTEAWKWNTETETYLEERFTTFNKGLFYNSRQSSGILNLVVKDVELEGEDYLLGQVQDFEGDTIILDKNEKNWNLNDVRDYRVDYSKPMFIENIKHPAIQEDYFIDKVVNENTIDPDKDWTQLEMLRDKYLVVRLHFDKFEDTKLIFNFSAGMSQDSYR